MSLTSYRAAPSRGKGAITPRNVEEPPVGPRERTFKRLGHVNGLKRYALAAKPGGDLLFHRLSDSTIGAAWFHGRVRDGIGWVTGAMTTKL